MKIIRSMPGRYKDTGIYLKSGAFPRMIECEWAKWPAAIKGSDVPSVACGPDDNLYAAASRGMTPCAGSGAKLHVARKIDLDGHLPRTFGTPETPERHGLRRERPRQGAGKPALEKRP
jgi:hypothetical protein